VSLLDSPEPSLPPTVDCGDWQCWHGPASKTCPAPPVGISTRWRLPCRPHAQVRPSSLRLHAHPASTWAPLPDSRISSTWRITPSTGYHAGPCSPSCVSHVLHALGHAARGTRGLRPLAVCPGFRHGIVSTPATPEGVPVAISGDRTQKLPPTPQAKALCHRPGPNTVLVDGFLGNVSQNTHRQALLCDWAFRG
jgi:hypothetical protein